MDSTSHVISLLHQILHSQEASKQTISAIISDLSTLNTTLALFIPTNPRTVTPPTPSYSSHTTTSPWSSSTSFYFQPVIPSTHTTPSKANHLPLPPALSPIAPCQNLSCYSAPKSLTPQPQNPQPLPMSNTTTDSLPELIQPSPTTTNLNLHNHDQPVPQLPLNVSPPIFDSKPKYHDIDFAGDSSHDPEITESEIADSDSIVEDVTEENMVVHSQAMCLADASSVTTDAPSDSQPVESPMVLWKLTKQVIFIPQEQRRPTITTSKKIITFSDLLCLHEVRFPPPPPKPPDSPYCSVSIPSLPSALFGRRVALRSPLTRKPLLRPPAEPPDSMHCIVAHSTPPPEPQDLHCSVVNLFEGLPREPCNEFFRLMHISACPFIFIQFESHNRTHNYAFQFSSGTSIFPYFSYSFQDIYTWFGDYNYGEVTKYSYKGPDLVWNDTITGCKDNGQDNYISTNMGSLRFLQLLYLRRHAHFGKLGNTILASILTSGMPISSLMVFLNNDPGIFVTNYDFITKSYLSWLEDSSNVMPSVAVATAHVTLISLVVALELLNRHMLLLHIFITPIYSNIKGVDLELEGWPKIFEEDVFMLLIMSYCHCNKLYGDGAILEVMPTSYLLTPLILLIHKKSLLVLMICLKADNWLAVFDISLRQWFKMPKDFGSPVFITGYGGMQIVWQPDFLLIDRVLARQQWHPGEYFQMSKVLWSFQFKQWDPGKICNNTHFSSTLRTRLL